MRDMGKPSIEDILSEHADRLNRGYRSAAWSEESDDIETLHSLSSLLAVAELVQETLVPVQPNPDFVRGLGKSLLTSARQGRKALTARTRRAAVIGATVFGSLISAASVIGIIVYVLRHRMRGVNLPQA